MNVLGLACRGSAHVLVQSVDCTRCWAGSVTVVSSLTRATSAMLVSCLHHGLVASKSEVPWGLPDHRPPGTGAAQPDSAPLYGSGLSVPDGQGLGLSSCLPCR